MVLLKRMLLLLLLLLLLSLRHGGLLETSYDAIYESCGIIVPSPCIPFKHVCLFGRVQKGKKESDPSL